MPYPPNVPLTADGDAGNAATFNAGLQALVQRTDHLLSLLGAIDSDQQLTFRDVPVAAGILPGQPVYFDTATGVFRRALAALDASSGLNNAAASSLWRGVVQQVSGTQATVVPNGSLTLPIATWEAVTDNGLATPGRYFLSSANSGGLTTNSGTLGILVGDLDSSGRMFLAGQGVTNFLNHVHHKVQLSGDPAGVPNNPSPGDPHTIPTPNAALRGWLPADGASFPGFVVGEQIPTGASFGYNLQQPDETFLRSLFPPVPVETAQLSLGGMVLDDQQVIVNQYGIWWMTDAYDQVPWAPTWAAPGDSQPVVYWTTRVADDQSVYNMLFNQISGQIQQNFGQLGIRSVATNADPGVSVSVDVQGNVLLTNTGVVSALSGLGVRQSSVGGLGDASAGFRGQLRAELNVEFEVPRAPDPARDVVAIGSTYAGGGTPLGLFGDRLNLPSSYADYQLYLGLHLPAVNYQPTFRLVAAVDNDDPVPVAGNITVRVYVSEPQEELITARLEHTFTVQMETGRANQLQAVVFTSPALQVTRNQLLIVRVEQNGGPSKLPDDSVRVLSVYASFARV